MIAMIHRHLSEGLLKALADTPVVFLAGARQTGKSTLAQHLANGPHPARYLSLDDVAVQAAAQRDSAGFVAGLVGDVVLDEVQRAPELLLAIKAEVDRDRRPGRFLLTGSANVLLLPRVAESLTGRIEVYTLWPFSQGEVAGMREGFIDGLFGQHLPSGLAEPLSRAALIERVVRGGYPEIGRRTSAERRSAWFQSYVATLLQRDVRDLAAIEGLAQLPQVLALLAARTGGHVSMADLSRTAGIPQTTLKRYVALLEALFLVRRLPAWSSNLTSRLLKSSKVYVTDSGLACDLLGLDEERLTADAERLGPMLEAFVHNELVKQAGWIQAMVRLFHFQAHNGREVDFVIEDRGGRCVAVEVKATASLTGRHVAGIEAFAALAGERFHRGVVLYTGREVVPFAANIHALPVSALWQMGAIPAPGS